jgi:hypothetical protein
MNNGCYKCGSPQGDSARLCPLCNKLRMDERERRKEGVAFEPAHCAVSDSSRSRLLFAFLPVVVFFLIIGVWLIPMPGSLISRGERPAIDEIRKPVSDYLISKLSCDQPAQLEMLDIESVGGFEREMGGYPVYAAFSVACYDGARTRRWKDSKDKRTVAAFVRRTSSGNFEAYVPSLFQELADSFEQEFADSFEAGIENALKELLEQLK